MKMLVRIVVAVWLALVGSGAWTAPQGVAAQGDWPEISFTQTATGLNRPMGIANAGDGSGRLFVLEQPGRIRIIKGGTLLATPFLDIRTKVTRGGSEQGLLGLAFAPDYAANGRFYVNYTNGAGDTVVARYRVSANPDQADPQSEQVVLGVDQPYANHNGGHLLFGPDGYLYIGLGDGGLAGDPQGRAQNPQELLGKMLRIDVETGAPVTYRVPAGNPFVGNSAYRPEIWALGLRNPWRYAFDRATGELYIGDVGQNAWEEINIQPAGKGGQNYGWDVMEGAHCYGATTCQQAGLTMPVAEYDRTGGSCSVTGGSVYRGATYPTLAGLYLYGDYCSGRLWGLRRGAGGWQSTLLNPDTGYRITAFGEDEAGNLYLADYAGTIYAISGTLLFPAGYLPLILVD